MNKAVLSYRHPQFAEKLRGLGYETIPSEYVDCFIEYERDHADMQCLIIDDSAFVLNCCRMLAESLGDSYRVSLCGENTDGKYPHNVALNAAVAGNHVICKTNALDRKVREYCLNNNYELINVNQGYAKCSCAAVADRAIITADNGIYNSLIESEIDVLKIEQGRVELEGADTGFIGGATGYDKSSKTLYFCGDITKHPDYGMIKAFCEKYSVKAVSLTKDTLTDIGGIVFC